MPLQFLRFVDCASLYNLVNKANLVHNFLSMFISFLYMFWASMCPSSGEITVFMWHLVFVTVCGRLVCRVEYQTVIHTEWQIPSAIYSYFSWWWAHSHPKHVEKRNKHTKKIVHQVGFIYKSLSSQFHNWKQHKQYCCMTQDMGDTVVKGWLKFGFDIHLINWGKTEIKKKAMTGMG